MSSPRAWGWTGGLGKRPRERYVVPTRVGVDRTCGGSSSAAACRPHARGGGPISAPSSAPDESSSPRVVPVASGPFASVTRKEAAYFEYLASAVWREKCREARARAGQVCEGCKSTGPLDVHHLTYDRFGGDELPADLRVLCRRCHKSADADREWDARVSAYADAAGISWSAAERRLDLEW